MENMQKDSDQLRRNEMLSMIKWYKMKGYVLTWSLSILTRNCRLHASLLSKANDPRADKKGKKLWQQKKYIPVFVEHESWRKKRDEIRTV